MCSQPTKFKEKSKTVKRTVKLCHPPAEYCFATHLWYILMGIYLWPLTKGSESCFQFFSQSSWCPYQHSILLAYPVYVWRYDGSIYERHLRLTFPNVALRSTRAERLCSSIVMSRSGCLTDTENMLKSFCGPCSPSAARS